MNSRTQRHNYLTFFGGLTVVQRFGALLKQMVTFHFRQKNTILVKYLDITTAHFPLSSLHNNFDNSKVQGIVIFTRNLSTLVHKMAATSS